MKPLKIEDHPERGFVEIEGIKYVHIFFKELGHGFMLNQPFEIIEKIDGTVTIHELERKEIKGDKK